jgi:hypothetical protein
MLVDQQDEDRRIRGEQRGAGFAAGSAAWMVARRVWLIRCRSRWLGGIA